MTVAVHKIISVLISQILGCATASMSRGSCVQPTGPRWSPQHARVPETTRLGVAWRRARIGGRDRAAQGGPRMNAPSGAAGFFRTGIRTSAGGIVLGAVHRSLGTDSRSAAKREPGGTGHPGLREVIANAAFIRAPACSLVLDHARLSAADAEGPDDWAQGSAGSAGVRRSDDFGGACRSPRGAGGHAAVGNRGATAPGVQARERIRPEPALIDAATKKARRAAGP
jgi:hypothetical protein